MSYMDMLSVLAAPLAMAYVVHTRLEYAQPGVKELLAPSPSEEELSQIQVTAPSLLEGLPPQQDANRIITGASGHIGGSIVQHLLARGEKNLRLIDRDTPDADVLANSGVEYIKCDITDEKAVREAICKPFPHSTLPTVIYHAAAIIRFWEDSSHNYSISYNINVLGTKYILDAAASLPGQKYLIYTSSAGTYVPDQGFVSFNRPDIPFQFSDETDLDSMPGLATSHYCTTKRAADKMVREADKKNGLRTLCIRPGMALVGAKDLFVASYFSRAKNPIWGNDLVHHCQAGIDVALVEILAEKALLERPDECAGQGFLTTGDPNLYTFGELRRQIQFHASRDLGFQRVTPAFMLFVAYIVKSILAVLYFVRSTFNIKPHGAVPVWMKEIEMLQPALFDTANCCIVIDDSRARKVFGYKHRLSTLKLIKLTVQQVGANLARKKGATELPSGHTAGTVPLSEKAE